MKCVSKIFLVSWVKFIEKRQADFEQGTPPHFIYSLCGS